MLWRLAFSAVSLVFGVCLGAGAAVYALQPELDSLRNQIEIQKSTQAGAEALWSLHRTELVQARLAAEAAVEHTSVQLADWQSKAEMHRTARVEIRKQLATCHNDLSMALESVEALRAKVDKIDKNCSNVAAE